MVKEGTRNSKLAILDYEVLKYEQELDLSVLKIHLHTGRHHQIRVQLSSRNHSILWRSEVWRKRDMVNN